MEDYPKTLMEFESRFSTEAACVDYLVQMRWPNGFVCPSCGGHKAWRTERMLFHCAGCGRQVSVTAGTIFQGTRKPLQMWFRAMWWVTSQKNGASANGLQQSLGLGSYQTAWTWLHKLRRAMVRPGRDQLNGLVEVDETYVGGPEKTPGRSAETKTLVAIAVEKRGRTLGRTRMAVVGEPTRDELCGFVGRCVATGSTVRTDGWQSYRTLKYRGYQHERILQQRSSEDPSELLPGVHRIASLLKRWLLGTHQGAVSRAHLPYYLDEFTFRFNRRKSKARGKLFFRLVEQTLAIDPAPYNTLIKPNHNI
ncbi:MAG: IS1595 family transposase [Pirellulaceae bacterium]|jgi:transposase-like protein/ribosomal protein L37AE/L43A|nr:IS1595 family transposase [Pirellulaceae bacterium]